MTPPPFFDAAKVAAPALSATIDTLASMDELPALVLLEALLRAYGRMLGAKPVKRLALELRHHLDERELAVTYGESKDLALVVRLKPSTNLEST